MSTRVPAGRVALVVFAMLPSRLSRFIARFRHMPAAEWRFVAEAWVTAPLVEAGLRLGGLRRTLDALDRWIITSATVPADATEANGRESAVAVGERLVRRAYRLHPWLRGACLERSVVQYAVHRRRGTPARLVIGVRRPAHRRRGTIDAHAWLEPLGSAPGEADFRRLYKRETV